MRVALINTNRIRPPIGPIGLDYVAEALVEAGHEPVLLDLCWEAVAPAAVAAFFAQREVGLVGLSLRNTDDCMYPSRTSFLGELRDTVAAVRAATDAPLVVGGCGFSVMPEAVLEDCGAEMGVWADGEPALVELATRLERGEDGRDAPGLVHPVDGGWRRNPPSLACLQDLPARRRSFVDNRRYFDAGGQAGFETKRGCPMPCSYCADPLAKGSSVRLRSPAAVAGELENLLAQGIDHLHTCDSEFNIPPPHARAVCEELARRGLGERLRWYAYCAPRPFDAELAASLRRAGCVGVNFGTDHGDPDMLKRLRRTYTADDIGNATRWCHEQGMAVMLDLLLGAPGETEASLRTTIGVMAESGADRVGVAYGVRLYPGTEVARQVADGSRGGLVGGQGPDDPLFFIEPAIAEQGPELIAELIGGDERFFFELPSAAERTSYNYNDHGPLQQALAAGYKGAFWDVLRRWHEDGAAR